MRRTIIALLLSAAVPAFAGTPTQADFPNYVGHYKLSDKSTMKVVVAGNHLVANIGEGKRVRLVPQGESTFVTNDQTKQIIFAPTSDGGMDVQIAPK